MPPQENDFLASHVKDHIEQLVDRRIMEVEQKWMGAFPDGDIRGHHDAHKSFINKAAEHKKLWGSVKEKVIGGIVWAFVVGLATAAFQYVKEILR